MSALARPMFLVGLVTVIVLLSVFTVPRIPVFQNAFAKLNEAESQGNATRDEVKGRNASDSIEAQNGDRPSKNQLQDGTLYKPSYSIAKANSRESFTIYPDKHLYKPGENVTLTGSIWAELLSELHDQANLVIMEVEDNKFVVARAEAGIDQNGEYSTTLMFPSDMKPGAYTVKATIQVDSELLDLLEPSVRSRLHSYVKLVIVNPSAFAVKFGDKEFSVDIATNSTSVKDFSFLEQQNIISFKVEGETGTKGVAQVAVPKELLGEDVQVSIDGVVIPEESNDVIVTSNTENELTLEINYHHSERTIQLHGKPIVPRSTDSPTDVSVILGSVVAILAVVSIFLSIRYVGRQRQMRKAGQRGERRFGFPSFPFGQKSKSNFCCMSCGTKHDMSACPNCGSKLKKATF